MNYFQKNIWNSFGEKGRQSVMDLNYTPCDDCDGSELNQVESPMFKRRGFIGLATFATAAVLSGVDKSHAALFYSTKPVEGIPDEWVREKGRDVLRYANYIKGLKLKNITPRMVLAPHFKKRGRISNSLPPKSMWKRLSYTLRVVDRLSYELRSPVSDLLSIYRSPRYNRSCGGRSKSLHMANRAVDVKFKNVGPYTVAKKARQMRSKGMFLGGVGRYSSFVHVDTRGNNVDW